MADPVNPLSLSDEDFLKMDAPVAAPAETVEDKPAVETPAADAAGAEAVVVVGEKPANETVPVKETPAADGKADGQEDPEGGAAPAKTEEKPKPGEAEAKPAEGTVPAVGSGEAKPKADGAKPEVVVPAARTADDNAKFFEKIMAPFQANGKTIELKSEEEVIQLMQQGANYTRKMQAIAPHRKVLTMLENNGLLSEDRLSFLIDLEKGDPAAVQKLLKDKGIDALSIDTEADTTYQAGNHTVTDNEVAFRTNLDDLGSSVEGKQTLQTIDTTWDDASKAELLRDPVLMPLIHAQKQNGIYDRVATEVDRRRMLGKIPATQPFIEAYIAVGDELNEQKAFDDIAAKSAIKATTVVTAPVVKTPIATTAAAPKPVVENGDKAGAASSTTSTTKPAKPFVNPLAMSDAEFDAQFKSMTGRV